MKVDKAIKIAENVLRDATNGLSEQLEEVLRTLISIAKQQEVRREEVSGALQLRYFKLMYPNIKESEAKIVADVLAKALKDKFIITRRAQLKG